MKEDSAYHIISEVSEKTALPTHVLRFWEKKFIDLKPRKATGGRRFYSSDDIELIIKIKSLLYDQGFTISGAIRFLKDDKNEKDHNKDDYTKANNLLNNAIYSLKKVKDIIKNY